MGLKKSLRNPADGWETGWSGLPFPPRGETERGYAPSGASEGRGREGCANVHGAANAGYGNVCYGSKVSRRLELPDRGGRRRRVGELPLA